MTFNLLTSVLTSFIKALAGAQARVGAAGGTLTALAVIELTLFALWLALDGGNGSETFRKFLEITFWFWFATHFPSLAKFFSDSLVQTALRAGGQAGDYGLLLDPSRIAGMGLDVTEPLAQSMHDAGIAHLGDVLVDAICYVVLLASFFLIACQVCLAVIEYYLVVTLASCLIPFGMSQHTRFLAQKAIGAAVAVSVKLMVLSFILALIEPVFGQLHLPAGGDELPLNQLLAMCLVCIVVAVLVWRAPSFASELLAASPSLNAGAVGQHITHAVSASASFLRGAAGASATTAAVAASGGRFVGGSAVEAARYVARALSRGSGGQIPPRAAAASPPDAKRSQS